MRSPVFSGATPSLLLAAATSGLVACGDTPTETYAGVERQPVAHAPVKTDKPGKNTGLHMARVKADGTLVDGTAVSAERISEGVYLVTFPQSIDDCVAAANSAFFPGADIAVFRILAHLRIGTASGAETVGLSLFNSTDGSSTDSSFSLLVVCP